MHKKSVNSLINVMIMKKYCSLLDEKHLLGEILTLLKKRNDINEKKNNDIVLKKS